MTNVTGLSGTEIFPVSRGTDTFNVKLSAVAKYIYDNGGIIAPLSASILPSKLGNLGNFESLSYSPNINKYVVSGLYDIGGAGSALIGADGGNLTFTSTFDGVVFQDSTGPAKFRNGIGLSYATNTQFRQLASTTLVVSPSALGNYSSQGGNSTADGGKFVRFDNLGGIVADQITGSGLSIKGINNDQFFIDIPVGEAYMNYNMLMPLVAGKTFAATSSLDGSVDSIGSENYPLNVEPTAGSFLGYLNISVNGQYVKIPYYAE